MDWNFLGNPVFLAPTFGLVGVLVGSGISAWVTKSTHRERLATDQNLAERKFEIDKELAKRKVSADIALAERKLALDRAFAAWKRRTDLAEEVLADFYEARDIIVAARSPGSFGDEGNTRQKAEWETGDDTRHLNSYYRTAERLNNNSALFAKLAASRNRFLALFGQKAAKPYDEIFGIRGEIFIAVRMLMITHRQRDQGSLSAWEMTIGWGGQAPDPIDVRLNQIIADIDEICRPVIQEVAP
jgi:hypothetical protein